MLHDVDDAKVPDFAGSTDEAEEREMQNILGDRTSRSTACGECLGGTKAELMMRDPVNDFRGKRAKREWRE